MYQGDYGSGGGVSYYAGNLGSQIPQENYAAGSIDQSYNSASAYSLGDGAYFSNASNGSGTVIAQSGYDSMYSAWVRNNYQSFGLPITNVDAATGQTWGDAVVQKAMEGYGGDISDYQEVADKKYKQYSVGGSASIITPLLVGLSGGVNAGIQTDGTFFGTQFFLQGQINPMLALGLYVGVGGNASNGTTTAPLQSGFSTGLSGYLEVDAGLVESIGYSRSFDTSGSGNTYAVPKVMPREGIGAGVGGGVSATISATTPTIRGMIIDMIWSYNKMTSH